MLSKNKHFFSPLFFGIIALFLGIDCVSAQPIEGKTAIKAARDPFLPLVTEDGRLLEWEGSSSDSNNTWTLEGIIFDPQGDSYAVINNDVVKAGDVIDDYQVSQIQPDKVILKRDDQSVEIELRKED